MSDLGLFFIIRKEHSIMLLTFRGAKQVVSKLYLTKFEKVSIFIYLHVMLRYDCMITLPNQNFFCAICNLVMWMLF